MVAQQVDHRLHGLPDAYDASGQGVARDVAAEAPQQVVAGIDVWPVLADPGQLENSLLNLCINARDAMPDGGRLMVETANQAVDEQSASDHGLAPGQYVSICVSDNGTGMPAGVVARAFDPFFTTKPIGEGTGLGLSMVYGFARQSSGHARIRSRVGTGTTICLYLPRHLGRAPTETVQGVEQPATALGHGETVLIVDDEAPVRGLMVEALEGLGCRVLEAENGLQAIEQLQSDPTIALLVTDVGLPGGMNGRQVADAARLLLPELRVLFVTGYAENAALSHGQLPQGMQILTKPFELHAFGQPVKDLITSPGETKPTM